MYCIGCAVVSFILFALCFNMNTHLKIKRSKETRQDQMTQDEMREKKVGSRQNQGNDKTRTDSRRTAENKHRYYMIYSSHTAGRHC